MAECGDPDLAAELRTKLGPRHPVAAIGVVTPQTTRTATIGTPLRGRFEIGSISKGVTGLLYVDAIERGEVRPETTVGEVLPVDDAPVAKVTLAALATHRSGLPRLAPPLERFGNARVTWRFVRRGTNPYTEDLAALVSRATLAKVGSPRPHYSNFGFELLGHAVATAAGRSFADLVHERISVPLGLDSFAVPATPDDLGPDDVQGTDRRRRERDPWTGEGIGPAGGIRASIEDMTTLVHALLDGSAPGIAALDPIADFRKPVRIGAAWITMEDRGRMITWHNGGTGGFRSWAGVDRDAGTGAVVLTATSLSVDRPALGLLTSDYLASA